MWIFKCVFVLCFAVFSIANPIDNDLSIENDKSSKDSAPPMEFPQNDSKFPVVDTNATLLHELSGNLDTPATQEPEIETSSAPLTIEPENSSKSDESRPEETKSNTQEVDESKIDTEVPDLLKIDNDLIEPPAEPEHNDIIDPNNDIDSDNIPPQAQDVHETVPDQPANSSTSTEDYPKAEVEWIQNGHDNEDVRLLADDDTLTPSHDYIREAYSEHGRGVPLVQGRYAAILAGIFIVLAVVGYAAMLSWRRYLENRYGNRQMLINEEDLYTANDLKHFSL